MIGMSKEAFKGIEPGMQVRICEGRACSVDNPKQQASLMSGISMEAYKKIKPGTQVRLRNGEIVAFPELDVFGQRKIGNQYITALNIESIVQDPKNSTNTSKGQLTKHTQSKKAVKQPKQKNPETVKLEALLDQYPDRKDEIFTMALHDGLTVDEIAGSILMAIAGEKLRVS